MTASHMSDPAETFPVLCPDGGEAASVWRSSKLSVFDWKVRVLGLDQDSIFADLLDQIGQHTAALEDIWEQQKQPDSKTPWWADGEYDGAKADGANDEGLRYLAAGQLSDAFASFTEAIRLHPTSAVYHCNRAAVCLQLKRADLAAEDARNAVQRDPGYLKAYLRGGRAHLQLHQPQEALQLLHRALELQPSHAGVAKCVTEANAMLELHARQQEQEESAAKLGSRPGLTRDAIPEAEAAEQLYAAAQMLKANPNLQAARCAHVEGLILCQRYREAQAECQGLMEGVDRLYLEAEVAWRQGDLQGATASLDSALLACPHSTKCLELRAYVGQLGAKWEEAQLAREDGALSICEHSSAALLKTVQPQACMGLYCAVSHLRAEAYAASGRWEEALRELNAALVGDGNDANCLQLRAEVHQQMGAHLEAVLDLQRLQKVAPGTPGLFALLEAAAKMCLGGGDAQCAYRRNRAFQAGAGVGCGGHVDGVRDAWIVLGLSPGANTADVRRAYLKLAGRWHPDRWVNSDQERREAAEVRFKQVQRAYEELSG